MTLSKSVTELFASIASWKDYSEFNAEKLNTLNLTTTFMELCWIYLFNGESYLAILTPEQADALPWITPGPPM